VKHKQEVAEYLGISPPYFSLIYHGRTKISKVKYEIADWNTKTRRTWAWWQEADLASVQQIFNRMLAEPRNGGGGDSDKKAA